MGFAVLEIILIIELKLSFMHYIRLSAIAQVSMSLCHRWVHFRPPLSTPCFHDTCHYNNVPFAHDLCMAMQPWASTWVIICQPSCRSYLDCFGILFSFVLRYVHLFFGEY